MSKMGIYGILRLLIPVCPLAFRSFGQPVVILAVAGIIYSSVIAIRQNDLKRFIAWVSIAHLGLVTAAALSLDRIAIQGSVIQMISHGINVVGLFIIADIIEVRTRSRNIDSLGGLAQQMPFISIAFMIIILATVALPLTSGFVGEFMMLLGLFNYSLWISLFAGLTIIFSVVYMLRMYQRVMLGNINPSLPQVQPAPVRNEILALIPLIIIIIIIGCYPKPFLDLVQPATDKLITLITAAIN
jgi:NADH-quinone oxidoreductase subunit M